MSSNFDNVPRRDVIPVIYTSGTHYEVGFNVVCSEKFSDITMNTIYAHKLRLIWNDAEFISSMFIVHVNTMILTDYNVTK